MVGGSDLGWFCPVGVDLGWFMSRGFGPPGDEQDYSDLGGFVRGVMSVHSMSALKYNAIGKKFQYQCTVHACN